MSDNATSAETTIQWLEENLSYAEEKYGARSWIAGWLRRLLVRARISPQSVDGLYLDRPME